MTYTEPNTEYHINDNAKHVSGYFLIYTLYNLNIRFS